MPSGFQAFGSAEGYVGSAAFTPVILSNLLAWYDATDAVNVAGKCSSLTPKGTSDAGRVATQATAGDRPTINASDAKLGGHQSLTYGAAGSSVLLVSGTWNVTLTEPWGVFIVGRTATATQPYIFDGVSGKRHSVAHNGFNHPFAFKSAALQSAATPGDDVATAWLVVWDGASSKIYLNSKTANITGDPGTSTDTDGVTLGNYLGGTGGGATIAAHVIVNAPSVSDIGKLFDWSALNYGVTLV